MHTFFILDSYYTLDMKPSKKELKPYIHDRKTAAKVFGVSEKTIIRWLKSYDLYEHGHYGRGKLNAQKAIEIREKHQTGMSMKQLAEEYGVTFATISRVVHRITYRDAGGNSSANVTVVYNPR